MRRFVSILFLGLLLAGCSASSGTPADSSDPLAAACPGSTDETLTALRTLFDGFLQNDQSLDTARTFATDQCQRTADPGADFDACQACFNAVIDEVYSQ